MISEKRLGELIQENAHFTTPHRLHCAMLSIRPEHIPESMTEEEIIEKLKTVCENYTPGEDNCDDSILEFTNPFTGKSLEFCASQGCPFFATYEESEEIQRLTRMLGVNPYKG
jgi:hypothetical protein